MSNEQQPVKQVEIPEEVLNQKVEGSPINEGITQDHAYSYMSLIKLLAIMKITQKIFEEALPAIQDSIYKDAFLRAGFEFGLKPEQELNHYWEQKLKDKALALSKVPHMASIKSESIMFQVCQNILEMYGTRFTDSVDPMVDAINQVLDMKTLTKDENTLPFVWEPLDDKIFNDPPQNELLLAFVPGSPEPVSACYFDDQNILRKLEFGSSSVFRTLPTLISRTENLVPLQDAVDFLDPEIIEGP